MPLCLCGKTLIATVSTRSFKSNIVIHCLRVALVVALVGAGWALYRKLPDGGSLPTMNNVGGQTSVSIMLRPPPDEDAAETALNVHVELYSVDVAAVRREFFDPDNHRAGLRFETFLTQRMKKRPPVAAQLDAKGSTTLTIAPGKWWIHATLNGAQSLEWRLPVNVTGQKLTIELTPANAYTRTESF